MTSSLLTVGGAPVATLSAATCKPFSTSAVGKQEARGVSMGHGGIGGSSPWAVVYDCVREAQSCQEDWQWGGALRAARAAPGCHPSGLELQGGCDFWFNPWWGARGWGAMSRNRCLLSFSPKNGCRVLGGGVS